jgi:hypothetical protein
VICPMSACMNLPVDGARAATSPSPFRINFQCAFYQHSPLRSIVSIMRG